MLGKTFATAASTLALGVSLCAAASTPSFQYGSPLSPVHAERSIAIKPDTRWANVKRGEAIRFVVDGREFGWKFDGPFHSFVLQRVASQGLLTKLLTVCIENKNNHNRQ